ncbi:hypothetical protein LG293_17720 (plasmid) [Citricoccus nitrophenolicus]
MTEVDTRNRQPKGVSNGGQFSMESKPEPGPALSLQARIVPVANGLKDDFFAAGGYEDGEHFKLQDVRRDDAGTWTVDFADHSDIDHGTGESHQAVWHPETGYRQDDTTRGDYYGTHINPDRDAEGAFARDLLSAEPGQEAAFFRRLEAQHQATSGAQSRRDTATMYAQWDATGLTMNQYSGDYETCLSDAWRNDDGSWSLQYSTDADDHDEDTAAEDIPRVSVTYTIDPADGLVSTRISPNSGADDVHPRNDPYAGALLERASDIEDLSQWAKDTEERWQAARG